jgi:hypothetical protein
LRTARQQHQRYACGRHCPSTKLAQPMHPPALTIDARAPLFRLRLQCPWRDLEKSPRSCRSNSAAATTLPIVRERFAPCCGRPVYCKTFARHIDTRHAGSAMISASTPE